MAIQDIEALIEIPPPDLMGPAMRRLNERQRRFVCALSVYGGDQAEAYRWAGYTCANENTANASASRLAANPDVIEAIKEEAWRRIDQASMLAVSTLVEIASPRSAAKNSDRLKAAEMILSRTGFHEKTEHKIVIKDERTTKELIDFIKSRAGAHGLDANQLLGLPAPGADAQIVDAEFEEVTLSSEGLEDVL